MTSILAAVVAALIFAAMFSVAVVALAYRAYVLSALWEWFMVPTFALPVLGFPMALGLVLVAACLRPQPNSDTPREGAKDRFIRDVLSAFIGPTFLLVGGLIVKGFL